MSLRMRLWMALLVSVLSICVASPAEAVPGYTVVDLGLGVWPDAINNRGEIVGSFPGADGQRRAFLWSGGIAHDLGSLAGTDSNASDINDAGDVVGMTMSDTRDGPKSFLYSNGVMTAFGPGILVSGINNRGQFSGNTPTGKPWPTTNGFTMQGDSISLLAVPEGVACQAGDINDAGTVVGWTTPYQPGGPINACYYDDAGLHILDFPGVFLSNATAINNRGQIIGQGQLQDGLIHALMWDRGQVIDLGIRGRKTTTFDINETGQVVGCYLGEDRNDHALLWENGAMVDLNSLALSAPSWVLGDATAINDAGWIAGGGISPVDGLPHGFLLVPVPDPGTGFALAVGLVALFRGRNRRR
jgi:probable HAF family extracellular repeat protein